MLRELLSQISADFANQSEKITNTQEGNDAKSRLQAALDNPNLTATQRDQLFEQLKNTQATRDTTKPKGTIVADRTDPTNQDVTLTLTIDEEHAITDIAEWTRDNANPKQFTKTLQQDEVVSVDFVDSYGNTGNATYTITNIDKIAPVCGDPTQTPTTPTNGKVVFDWSAVAFDAKSGLVDNQVFTCAVTENNQKCSITLRDKARNSRVCESSVVTNIDKTNPE